jgi:hypothetical protein
MSKRYHFTKDDIKAINYLVYTIDKEINVFKSRNYAAEVDQKRIYLGSKRYNRTSAMFMNFWKEETTAEMNWCVLSILHEVGHIMTTTPELEENRHKRDAMYSCLYSLGAISELEYFNGYFNIPAERNATEWAIEFYKTHFELCNALALQFNV